ncbi:MAG TPA: PQQ-binding-like beta-propeller repeat protein [Vicinamibacterales bacterium]|nr:PQQ-binding-like beta-propeller repeat protein [Vicinamibacterales bacterium]
MTCSRLPLVIMAVVALTNGMAAQDWPQWRGPNRDGAIASFQPPASWPAALTKRWNVNVGTGYAVPVVVGDRVYIFTRQGEREIMTALDVRSAKVIWQTGYAAPFKMNPATAPHGPGPKSTPTFAGDRLFTLGISGIVTAFDAKTGRQIWQKPAPPVEPLYHTAMSPLVDGNLVILHVGGHDNGALTAFDVATGDIRWSWNGDGPAYGSPLIFDLSGTRQVVTFTQKYFVGVSAATGALLWRRPYTTPSTTTSQTPIRYKDTVIEMGRGNGVTAFRAVRRGNEWATEHVWHTDEVSMHMSDAVAIDGVLFGLSHLNSGEYFALDLDTGKVLWKSEPRQAAHAAIVRAGNTIFSLEDDHELRVIRHSRTRFDPVARYDVATSDTWTQPAISGNRIFVKDVSSLTLWTID